MSSNMKFAALLLTIILFVDRATPAFATGMRCRDHPLYKNGMNGEIIKSWVFAPRGNRKYWKSSTYIPRSEQYKFVPHNDPESTKYIGLDLFLTAHNRLFQRKFLTINYQRQATTYLLVHAEDRKKLNAKLTGWKSEGWARRTSGHPYCKHTFGLGQKKGELTVPYNAYVFSKVGNSVSVPSKNYIRDTIRFDGNFRTSGHYSVLVAESNGSPVRQPTYPKGMRITAGQMCPRELHEQWVAKELDKYDRQTSSRKFASWHPLWDPCFFCSYGHEHGSAAPLLMGYRPRYGYTALKNHHQKEAHEGFKDIVADAGSHLLYVSVHALMSSGSRFRTRHHTMVIAAVRKSTMELELELRFKADYGSLAVRKRGGGIVSVSKQDEELLRVLGSERRRRVVNIINPVRIDRRWRYRKGDKLMKGEYEEWTTKPMCSAIVKGGEPTVDFKDPALAKRDVSGKKTTRLGRIKDGRLRWNASVSRELSAKKWVIGGDLCEFGSGVHGTFYTDVYGKEVKKGPGENNVRQFIKKGVRIEISGDFGATDPWLGLYLKGTRGELRNIGFGIDETVN